MNWVECKLKLPEPMTEVLVWIDGKHSMEEQPCTGCLRGADRRMVRGAPSVA